MQDDSSTQGLEQVLGESTGYRYTPHVPFLEPDEIALWRKVDIPHYGTRICALNGRIEMLVSAIDSGDWTRAKRHAEKVTIIYDSVAERYTAIPVQELNYHFPKEDMK